MRKANLGEAFKKVLDDGWIMIASNIYTPEYFTGLARAMYETKSPGIVQASSDTLPCLHKIYSQIIKEDSVSVNDLLRGAARLSHQRKAIEEEIEEKGDIRDLAIYLAIDHSDPLNRIFLGTRDHLTEYRNLISGTPQEEEFIKLDEEINRFSKDNKERFTQVFVIPEVNAALGREEALCLLAKYLLFTEKILMGKKAGRDGIDIDIDYIALDFSFPTEINVPLTRVVTVARDFYAKDGRYVLIESGFGIEAEKKVLSEEEQREYAKRVTNYVVQTSIDGISCNIGTYHGEMGRGKKGINNLHTILMSDIRRNLKKMGKDRVIIVAHGGSSISDECLCELDIPRLGLAKINKASVYINRYAKEIRDYVNSPDVYKDGKFIRGASKGFNLSSRGIEGIKDESKRLFELAGSKGKASSLYVSS